MTFGEKLHKLRDSQKLTQTQMAELLGVSLRTYQYYEAGRMYPEDSTVYQRIASRFNVTVDNLLNDQDLFIIEAQLKYGARGREQAAQIIEATEALYAGGTLSEEDEKAFYRQMTRIFDKVKQRNARRYAERMRAHERQAGNGEDEHPSN